MKSQHASNLETETSPPTSPSTSVSTSPPRSASTAYLPTSPSAATASPLRSSEIHSTAASTIRAGAGSNAPLDAPASSSSSYDLTLERLRDTWTAARPAVLECRRTCPHGPCGPFLEVVLVVPRLLALTALRRFHRDHHSTDNLTLAHVQRLPRWLRACLPRGLQHQPLHLHISRQDTLLRLRRESVGRSLRRHAWDPGCHQNGFDNDAHYDEHTGQHFDAQLDHLGHRIPHHCHRPRKAASTVTRPSQATT
ncbi:hypothetical protein V8E36_006247 [Tilletia maclaganii]